MRRRAMICLPLALLVLLAVVPGQSPGVLAFFGADSVAAAQQAQGAGAAAPTGGAAGADDAIVDAATEDLERQQPQAALDAIARHAGGPPDPQLLSLRADAEIQQRHYAQAEADLKLARTSATEDTDLVGPLADAYAALPGPAMHAQAVAEAERALAMSAAVDTPADVGELLLGHGVVTLAAFDSPAELAAALATANHGNFDSAAALLLALELQLKPLDVVDLLQPPVLTQPLMTYFRQTPAQGFTHGNALLDAMQQTLGVQPWLEAAQLAWFERQGEWEAAATYRDDLPASAAASRNPWLAIALNHLAARRARAALDNGDPQDALDILTQRGDAARHGRVLMVLFGRARAMQGAPAPVDGKPAPADPDHDMLAALEPDDAATPTATVDSDLAYWNGLFALMQGDAAAADIALAASPEARDGSSPAAAYWFAVAEEKAHRPAATVIADWRQALQVARSTLFEPFAVAALQRLHQPVNVTPRAQYTLQGQLTDVFCRNRVPAGLDIFDGTVEYRVALPSPLPPALKIPGGCGIQDNLPWVSGSARPNQSLLPDYAATLLTLEPADTPAPKPPATGH